MPAGRYCQACPRDQQADPDDVSKQAQEINRGQFRDAFLPQFSEIRERADGKEGHYKEDPAKNVGFSHGRFDFGSQSGNQRSQSEYEHESGNIAQDELGESLPDLRGANFLSFAPLNLCRPDPRQDEGPHADKNINEYLYRGGSIERPARLKICSRSCQGFGVNQRVGNGSAGHRGSISFD